MFTEEHLYCVSGIKIDNSDCLQQCSGIIVTSYDQEDEQEDKSDIRFKKLVEYMSGSGNMYFNYFKNMAEVFQGSDKNLKINSRLLRLFWDDMNYILLTKSKIIS